MNLNNIELAVLGTVLDTAVSGSESMTEKTHPTITALRTATDKVNDEVVKRMTTDPAMMDLLLDLAKAVPGKSGFDADGNLISFDG